MLNLKKATALLLAAGLTLSAGCSNTTQPSSSVASSAPTVSAASSAAAAEPEQESATRTITDALGASVTIPAKVDSVAAISWPWPAMVFAVTGKSDSITCMPGGAMDSYLNSMFHVLAPGLENVNTSYLDASKNMNYEELAKVQPDIMLLYPSEIESVAEQVKKIGVTPVTVNYGKLQDVQDAMRVLGEIFEVQDRAASMAKLHQESIAAVEAKKEQLPPREKQKRVLYLYSAIGDGTYRVFAGKSLGQDYLNMVGGVNVAEELDSSQATVSMEQILEWDPDVILLSNFHEFMPEDFAGGSYGGADWSKLKAVKEGKIYKTPMGIYRWDPPCAESYLMLQWMANLCNPEIFDSFDIRGSLASFYQEYFDYSLTEEEIDQILNSKSNIGLGC